jgi:hypothetical protein
MSTIIESVRGAKEPMAVERKPSQGPSSPKSHASCDSSQASSADTSLAAGQWDGLMC